ncbi:MAG TPA: MFS transporter [Mycobacteriales bacterium]|nr:MFS transporter [Mycobacteriales bacterium]
MFARYQVVLRRPHVARMLLTAMLARLPQGMSGLAVLLLLTPHVGYARAGLATGISVATSGLSNVLLARGVDRLGARKVLVPSAAVYAAAMVVLAIESHGSYSVQIAICALIGLSTPPVTSVSRGLWPRLLEESEAQVVYGLEATAQELIYISGPAAVALIAGLASARTAVVASGLIGLVGVIAYVTAPPLGTPLRAGTTRRVKRVLFGTGVVSYALVGLCITLGFNMTDIATVDFVGGRKASAAAGVVLAVWSLGSLLGGVRFGASRHEVTDRRLARVAGLAAGGLALAALAPDPVGLAVILLFGGACVAPTMARLYTRMGAVAPDGSTTEAFGWLAVGFLSGSSLGSMLGGVSVDGLGPRWTFVLAGVAASGAMAVIAARRPVASSGGR